MSAKIQDLSSQLKLYVEPFNDLRKYRRFNNSLIHYKGPYYFMTYRLFYPRNIRKKYHGDHERTYHPWNSWWASFVDQTVLVLLRWENHQLIVLHETLLYYPERLKLFDQQFDDSRIAKLQNKFYVYGQAWLSPHNEITERLLAQAKDQKKEAAPIAKCMSQVQNCDAAVVIFAKVAPKITKNYKLEKATVENISMPCVFRHEINKIHGKNESIEKNWCFFEADNEVWFQYMLHPFHVISLDCTKSYVSPSPLEHIKKHYGCSLYFSPGGPLARWKPGQLIGCGHVKYNYSCLKLLSPIEHTLLHPDYVYALWFYTIEDKPPFKMLQLSYGYVPKYSGQRYSLVFPMGCIEIDKSLWAISMGNGDSTPNIMTVSKKEIEDKLIPVEKVSTTNYKVEWWDVENITS